jgi:hypothetical protein
VDDARRQAPAFYQIEVRGKLDESWTRWLDGMAIARTHARDGTPIVVLSGPVADQSALRGLLSRLWDLNLTILALRRVTPPDEPERGAS